MPVARYRKKPVEIDAARWDGTVEQATEIINWVLANDGTARYHGGPPDDGPMISISTREGIMVARPGAWVLMDVQGFHPCDPGIFAETHELTAEHRPDVADLRYRVANALAAEARRVADALAVDVAVAGEALAADLCHVAAAAAKARHVAVAAAATRTESRDAYPAPGLGYRERPRLPHVQARPQRPPAGR